MVEKISTFRISFIKRIFHKLTALTLAVMCLLASFNNFAYALNLSWDPSPSPGVGGYKLHYGYVNGDFTVTMDVGLQTTFTVTGLTAGETYKFVVTAYDTTKQVESGPSNEITALIPPSGRVTFTASSNSVSVGEIVTLTDTSDTTLTGTRDWDTGDGFKVSTGNGGVVVKQYSAPGNYQVNLCVAKDCATQNISVTDSNTPAPVPESPTQPPQTPVPQPENPPTQPTQQPSGPTPKLVAAYGFDELYSLQKNRVYDASGNENNGKRHCFGSDCTLPKAISHIYSYMDPVSNSPVSVDFGRALQFNGTNNLVIVPDSNTLDLKSGMTIEAWVKIKNPNDPWQSVAIKKGSVNSQEAVYSLYGSSDKNVPASELKKDPDNSESFIFGATPLIANQWNHIATTFDGTTQKMFVNGVQVSSQQVSAASGIKVSDGNLYIGGNKIWGGQFLKGAIDEVRIYDGALDTAKIIKHMTKPLSKSLRGFDSIYDTRMEVPKGMLTAIQVTAPASGAQSGTVTRLQAFIDEATPGTSTLRMALYSDLNGRPSKLLNSARGAAVRGSWTSLSTYGAKLVPGANYWIVFSSNNGPLSVRHNPSVANIPWEQLKIQSTSGFPKTWPQSKATQKMGGEISVRAQGYKFNQ